MRNGLEFIETQVAETHIFQVAVKKILAISLEITIGSAKNVSISISITSFAREKSRRHCSFAFLYVFVTSIF